MKKPKKTRKPMTKKDWEKVPVTHRVPNAGKKRFAPEQGKYIE